MPTRTLLTRWGHKRDQQQPAAGSPCPRGHKEQQPPALRSGRETMQCAHELSSKSPALKAATLWVRVPLPKPILALPTGWGEGLGMSGGLPGSAGPAWARGRALTGPGGEQGRDPGGVRPRGPIAAGPPCSRPTAHGPALGLHGFPGCTDTPCPSPGCTDVPCPSPGCRRPLLARHKRGVAQAGSGCPGDPRVAVPG